MSHPRSFRLLLLSLLMALGFASLRAQVISDDFYPETTYQNFWRFHDPVGDCSVIMTGTNALISVPEGTSHNLWTEPENVAPRLLQPAPDIDLGLEVKLESIPVINAQYQGIIVQEDDNTFMRFGMFYSYDGLRLFAAFVDGTSYSTYFHEAPPVGTLPYYLQVLREKSTEHWTFKYSEDGLNWTTATDFYQAISVTEVGFYSGNNTYNPYFLGNFDYFMSLDDPIVDDDEPMTAEPIIDAWYGETQDFGHLGNPQQWVNILGRAWDPDGIASLFYRVNDGPPIGLTMGPDGYRLINTGDFIIEIDHAELFEGANLVEITTMNNLGVSTVQSVIVNYQAGQVWPTPYLADWSSLNEISEINNVAQIVDGLWTLTSDGIRTVEIGYDRLIVIGDETWIPDYEVEAPLTIHSADSGAGVGFAIGWQGHTGSKRPRRQWPLEAIAWVKSPLTSGSRLEIATYPSGTPDSYTFPTDGDVTYILKMQSTLSVGGNSTVSAKIWQEDSTEPADWQVQAVLPSRDGSVLMICHHCDVTWGNVTITPIGGNHPPAFTSSPVKKATVNTKYTYNITAGDPDPGDTLDITAPLLPIWLRLVDNGDGTAVLNGIPTIFNQGINEVQLMVVDSEGEFDTQPFSIYVLAEGEEIIISDDFYPEKELQSFWRFLDPAGDCTLTMTGTNTHIQVPEGSEHDLWSHNADAPRILQTAIDDDLALEVKFESLPWLKYQIQGIIVQQDADTFLRFGVYATDDDLRLFAGSVDGSTTEIYLNQSLAPGATPYFLQVIRDESISRWTYLFSEDGSNWTPLVEFDQQIAVSEVGLYTGNSSPNPAYLGNADYFMNLNEPIIDSDEPVSCSDSSVEAIPSEGIPADGVSYSTITVTVIDQFGNPMSDQIVELAATGPGNIITQPGGPTGPDGIAVGTLASTAPGVKVVFATVNPGMSEIVLYDHPSVEFIALDPYPDIFINGDDGPLYLTESDMITVTIDLDPGDLEGMPADWWVFLEHDAMDTWYCRYNKGDPKWSVAPPIVRFGGATLRSVSGFSVLGPRTLPVGHYVFTFAVDDNKDDIYDGTFLDTVVLTVE